MQAIMSLHHFWQSGSSGWVWRQMSQTSSLFLMCMPWKYKYARFCIKNLGSNTQKAQRHLSPTLAKAIDKETSTAEGEACEGEDLIYLSLLWFP